MTDAANELVPYLFSGGSDSAEDAPAPVRLVMRGDVPWFVALDVCRVLGISKHRDALTRLESDERGSVLVDTPGGPQQVGAVSESGLYALIFRSRKPIARKFRRWVTEEVLPSIRRTGRYENTIAIGRHPQGPALSLKQIEGALHQHQMRVLAAVRALSNTDGRACVTGFGQIAELAGLSVPSAKRAVRLLASLGFIAVNDPHTAGHLDALNETAGSA